MITFKAFNSKLQCRDFQYEIGKEYQFPGKIKMCESGFHSCGDVWATANFYKFEPDKTRWAECEIPDDSLYDEDDNKYCSSSIRIIREIFFEEIIKEHKTCKGCLDMRVFKGLTYLPEGLSVCGELYLSGCTGLKNIPEKFKGKMIS